MDGDTLVKVERLSKKFCRDFRKSLWYGTKDLLGEIVNRKTRRDELRPDEFLALKDISFEVKRGEMMGVIGQNGAGKSTLLKLLNGLMMPDEGRITIMGRVQALIELGAGFSPILTGRENVYINASVLGISKEQVDRALPSIIEYAGIEEFMDTPVQSYSSGMKARLGFALITQLDPDVLLIDEVLAVGDVAFQEKCMRRMDAMRRSDKAIIFVTHSLYQVEALCNKALWLERGRIVRYGDAGDVVRAFLDNQERLAMEQSRAEGIEYEGRITAATKDYLEKNESRSASAARADKTGLAEELIQLVKIEIEDGSGRIGDEVPFLSDVTVRIHYNAVRPVERPLFNLRFFTNGHSVFEASMLIDGPGPDVAEGEGIVECIIPALPLTPKLYEIKMFTRSGEGICDLMRMRTVAYLRVTDENLDAVPLKGPMAVNHLRQGSPVYIERTWKFYNGDRTALLKTVEGRRVHGS